MNNTTLPQFPQSFISHLDPAQKPDGITKDRLAGIEYAISTLPEAGRRWICLRFREGLSAEDTARILELPLEEEKALAQDTVQKLRWTSRWDWIRYGIEGNVSLIKTQIRANAFEDGYRKGLEDGRGGKVLPTPDAATLALPVSALALSNRVLGVLDRKELTTVGSLLDLDEYDVMAIRGLGVRGVAEVGLALRQLGITGTAWERHIR